MNIRRTIAAAAAATAVVATSLTFGIAAPASAATIVIPTCNQMLADPPTYFDDFAAINGGAAVRYRPAHALYGSANATLKNYLHSWGARNCSWNVAKTTSRNFTISEVRMTKAHVAKLQRWMRAHGIVGTDVEATMGGILYQVSDHEWSLLVHNSVWISIVERRTSLFGYTMQAASYSLYDLNPSL